MSDYYFTVRGSGQGIYAGTGQNIHNHPPLIHTPSQQHSSQAAAGQGPNAASPSSNNQSRSPHPMQSHLPGNLPQLNQLVPSSAPPHDSNQAHQDWEERAFAAAIGDDFDAFTPDDEYDAEFDRLSAEIDSRNGHTPSPPSTQQEEVYHDDSVHSTHASVLSSGVAGYEDSPASSSKAMPFADDASMADSFATADASANPFGDWAGLMDAERADQLRDEAPKAAVWIDGPSATTTTPLEEEGDPWGRAYHPAHESFAAMPLSPEHLTAAVLLQDQARRAQRRAQLLRQQAVAHAQQEATAYELLALEARERADGHVWM